MSGWQLAVGSGQLSVVSYQWAVGSGQLAVISGGLGVEGRFDSQTAALQYVGVDHGGFDVFVPEEFLYGADVVACL